ncbi:MAG: hypothetical protein D6706_12195 [Chloroflexi bacterium]|nr:MAG: hypothetical protein D6706_12195 [Chloroflexota bacterium]
MRIPAKVPGLRFLTVLMVGYGAVWMSLEGGMVRVLVMGVGITAVSLLYTWQKWFGGRMMSKKRWLVLTAVSGLAFGTSSGILTLIFMAVKTGIHAHGPEFTPSQIEWVLRQIPFWAVAGCVAGLGIGLVGIGRFR